MQSEDAGGKSDSLITGVICGAAMGFMGSCYRKCNTFGFGRGDKFTAAFSAVASSLGEDLQCGVYDGIYSGGFTTAVCNGVAAVAFAVEKIHIKTGERRWLCSLPWRQCFLP